MIADRITLRNFGPFAGEQAVDLGAGVFAVVAKLDGVEGRSNWLGKSTFLEAFAFALYGDHREKTEDAWIHDGAAEGGVVLELDDGTVIERARKRGKSTQVTCLSAKGEKAAGAAAEKAIREIVGLSLEDYRASSYVAQKQMARMVSSSTEPAERMRIVGGWFRLEPLAAAAASTARDLGALLDEVRKLEERSRGEEETAKDVFGQIFGCHLDAVEDAEEAMAAVIAAAEKGAEEAEGDVALLATKEARDVERRALVRDAETFSVAVQRGMAAKADLERVLGGNTVAHVERLLEQARDVQSLTQAQLREANREREAKRALARGEFSGTCPVAGIACPAAAEIRGRVDENRKLALIADEAQAAAAKADDEIRAIVRGHEKVLDQARRCSTEIEVNREAALRTQAAARRAKELSSEDPAGDAVARASVSARARELRSHVGRLEQARDRVGAALGASRKAWEAAGVLRGRERALRAATAVLGRQGAQRVVAELGLGEIEAGANRMLGDLGIELSVRLGWSREGTGLAAACEDCGASYPASAKVKACGRCGAARGANVIQRLEPELSDRSGAAEDLGGAAIQLSASSWLRAERGTPWEVVLLDEPFGSLDMVHRKAFASHLTAMLRAGAVRQSFVVAHHVEVTDALPRKVLVESDGRRSRLSVLLPRAWRRSTTTRGGQLSSRGWACGSTRPRSSRTMTGVRLV